MSLIEQAAKRLEELRRAGVEVPDDASAATAAQATPSILERAMSAERTHGATVPADAPAPAAGGREAPPHPRSGDGQAGVPIGATQSRAVTLDLARLSAAGIITPDAPRSQIADEFRIVKRPLLANASGKGAARVKNGNLIMVTSALPGEGKSFSAINLAMSIAMELDHTVLLVDADVARPSVPRMLDLEPAKGLLDVLVDDSVDLRGVLLKTNVEKLSILQAGTKHPRATELLASDAMNRLLDDMAQRYADRIIIFDSPPLLLTTESPVLATHVGQVVVVVEAQRTPQNAVKQALAAIDACPVKMMMLNKGRAASGGDGYGYGYGYGYGR
ncbi:MAG: tyrosine-protein kinase family protein [Betaproteobacteria bacterium]|nr:tyrosine-protein kinase family protein [Betaproteobacteria bacterium]